MRGIALALVSLALGCAGEAAGPEEVERARGDAVVGGQVVSTVDGHPITLADVRHAVEVGGVSPEVALRRLQDELLLARAARRAGFADDDEARVASRRAAVRRLLADEVEAPHGPDTIDEARLAEIFEENLDRFERPERRASVAVTARVPPDAPPELDGPARLWVEHTRAELAAADDPTLAAFAVRRQVLPDLPFEVTVDELDPASRRDEVDPAYLRALFAPDDAGVLPDVVRSAIGWHAVVLTEIEPAAELTREEALARLREQQIASARAQSLQLLVARLGRSTGVQVDREAVRAAFARPDLLGAPP